MKNLLMLLTAVALFSIAACRKDRENTVDNTVTQDNSTAENYFSDLYKVVDDVSANTEGIRDYTIGCIDTIIVDTTSSPRMVTVDFGTDDCVGQDLRIRKGKIHITYTGRYRDAGTIITVTPENYTVDGYLIQGTKTITNQGTDANGHKYFSVVVNGSITAPANAYTITWNSTRTRTWVEGSNTATIWDDVYEITGSASGVGRSGNDYSIQITQALRAEIGCRWIVQGKLLITPENADARTVDFGTGDCNAGFTVTVGTTSYPINGGN
jgi:hypothetical protein